MEHSDLKRPEPAEPTRPYTKPVVERIPLTEAQAGISDITDDLGVGSS
jgi:hypothetical protein